MKKILIDGFFLGTKRGIGNYLRKLLGEMHGKEFSGSEFRVTVFVPRGYDHSSEELPENINIIEGIGVPILWESFLLPIIIRRLKPDLILSPGNISPWFLFGRKQILIIHDCIFLLPKKTLPRSNKIYQRLGRMYLGLNTRLFASRSSALITISEHSAHDIEKYLHIPKAKIKVIYGSVGQSFDISKNKPKHSERDIYLHFYSIDPRKNSERVIEAYLSSSCFSNGHHLYLIGDGAKKRSKGLHELGVFGFDFLKRDELNKIVSNVRALLYPSLYEGFGLPILEFNCSSIPVITSNSSACEEVAGNFNFVVNPASTRELISAMEFFQNDNNVLNYSNMALQNCQRFNWARYRRGIVKVLREV